MKRRILQLLTWNLNDITASLDKIKESNFTHIQISPIQKCKEGEEWWKAYQPYSFEIGNRYGTKEDFIKLCKEAHIRGLQIIVDVVLRHLAGDEINVLLPHRNCNQDIVRRKDFWLEPIDCSNYNDRWQEINRCTGLPLLNYNHKELQDRYYIPFLDEVLTYADGLRVDQMKHYALPREGGTFCQNVLNRYKNKFVYGECINLTKEILNQYSEFCLPLISAYDNFDCNNCVRFFESADTYKSFLYTVGMTDEHRINSWNEITNRYDNCIFYAREWDKLIFSDRMKQINRQNDYVSFEVNYCTVGAMR